MLCCTLVRDFTLVVLCRVVLCRVVSYMVCQRLLIVGFQDVSQAAGLRGDAFQQPHRFAHVDQAC